MLWVVLTRSKTSVKGLYSTKAVTSGGFVFATPRSMAALKSWLYRKYTSRDWPYWREPSEIVSSVWAHAAPPSVSTGGSLATEMPVVSSRPRYFGYVKRKTASWAYVDWRFATA